MDEKTKEIYSRKFQFLYVRIKEIKVCKRETTKKAIISMGKTDSCTNMGRTKSRNQKVINTWKRALEEMIKISQDEIERYLYLREEMAESDRVSQIQSAKRIGHKEGKKEGEILKLITQVQKKIARGDSLEKIADDLIEDETVIKPIYQLVQGNPNKTEDDIYQMLNLL